MKIFNLLIIFIFLSFLNAYSGSELVGTTSINFIKIPPIARAVGMGEAFTAVSDGTSGLYYNPAGLTLIPGFEILGTHIEWFQSLRYEFLSFISPVPNFDTVKIGLSFSWFQVDKMAKTRELPSYDYTYLNSGVDFNSFIDKYFSPFDYSLTAGFATDIMENYAAGILLRYSSQNIDNFSGSNITSDFGFMYKALFGESFLRLGFTVCNIGTELKMDEIGYSAPFLVKIGISDKFPLFNWDFLIAAQAIIQQDYESIYNIGFEYWIYNLLAIRASYKTGAFDQTTFGAGIKYSGFEIDYAFLKYAELGDTHRFSLLYSWGTPPVNLKLTPFIFSPNNDKFLDYIYFTPVLKTKTKIKSAKLDILDDSGKVILTTIPLKAPIDKSVIWNGQVNNLTLPDGNYKSSISVEYENGTSESEKQNFEIDTTPPDLFVDGNPKYLKPGEKEALIIPATFTLSAKDKNNIAKWQFIIWDVNKNVFYSTGGNGEPPPSFVWDGKGVNDEYVKTGEIYYYSLIAYDTVGNKAQSQPKAQVVLLKEIKITFSSDALFDLGKADVKISAYNILRTMKKVLDEYPETNITVAGHTDNISPSGTKYKTNKELSKARADAVKFFMVNLLSVDEKRITTVGYGEDFPIATNETEEGRAKNRRVEIILKSTIYK